MDKLEIKNYRATFVDSEGIKRNVYFSTDAPRHDLVVESAYSEIKRQTGINPKDVYDLGVDEINVW